MPTKHFVDLVHDIPSGEIDTDTLKGIIRNKAWGDLPDPFRLSGNPNFDYKTQYLRVTQNNGNYTLVKHVFLTKTACLLSPPDPRNGQVL